jgi:hypothetical protein
MNNEIKLTEDDDDEPEPIEEIRELLGQAAFTAIMAGISQDEFMRVLIAEWEMGERSAEIEKQLEKEWNAKPEAERKALLEGAAEILSKEQGKSKWQDAEQ